MYIAENHGIEKRDPSIEINDIQVSIVLTVFNHGAFLSRALDMILAQKTSFRYEIVAGDDASTDNSAEILREYARRYPDIFSTTYRSVNLGGTKNFVDLVRKCRGRYITFIDGDDYWTDSEKLQIQFDFLERNNQFFSISHQVSVCNADGDFIYTVPADSYLDYPININSFLHGNRFPLTATMMRLEPGDELDELLDLIEAGSRNAGDTTICLYLLDRSDIHVLRRAMSVYLRRTIEGHSNYNSITRLPRKIHDKLNILRVNDIHYSGKYCFWILYLRLMGTAILGFRNARLSEYYKLAHTIPMIMFSFAITLMRRFRYRSRSVLNRIAKLGNREIGRAHV